MPTDVKTKVSALDLVSDAGPLPAKGDQITFYVRDGSQPLATQDRQIRKRDLLMALLQSGDELGDSSVDDLTAAQQNGIRDVLGSAPANTRLWMPATVWFGTSYDGAAAAIITGTSTTPEIKVFDFAGGSNHDSIETALILPPTWDGGLKVRIYWTASSTGTVLWEIDGASSHDGDALQPDFGTVKIVLDAVIQVSDVMITSLSPTISIPGSSAAGQEIIYLRLTRSAQETTDTISGAVRLIGVMVEWTESDDFD